MGKLVVVSVGFDVNLVLRSLLKLSLTDGDAVLLLYSKSGGEYEQRKVEEAVKALKNLLSGARVEHHDAVVTGMDFAGDVAAVLKALKEHSERTGRIVASLVGGMRIVIMEALVALILYKRFVNTSAEIAVHVMREDGVYDIILPLSAADPPELGPREAEVLRRLGEGLAGRARSEAASTVSREMGVTESMAYKVLESLERKGLVEIVDGRVELTLLGRLVLAASQ
ncbi:MAG: CRISPR-associated CARF protein Csa3 [Thermosphaera sp.]